MVVAIWSKANLGKYVDSLINSVSKPIIDDDFISGIIFYNFLSVFTRKFGIIRILT